MFWITIEHKSRCDTLKYIGKILQTSDFWYFLHIWQLPSKTIIPTCTNFDIYLHAKNELHCQRLF